jgi:hypothetical protein
MEGLRTWVIYQFGWQIECDENMTKTDGSAKIDTKV